MMPHRSTSRVTIDEVDGQKLQRREDVVAVEEPLEIRLIFGSEPGRIEKSISITMRTPGNDFELAAGFLLSEGIILGADDIHLMTYCVGAEKEKQRYNIVRVALRPGSKFDPECLARNFYTTSSCGVCGKASLDALRVQSAYPLIPDRPVISGTVVSGLSEKLRKAQPVFEKTGGLHAAALFDVQGELFALKEDIGRHNAVDKLIGEQLMAKKLPLVERIMFVSGRTSFEIMQKAYVAGIPIVAAVGAPSSLAIDLANEFGMTLIGFVRGERFNIYAGAQRLHQP